MPKINALHYADARLIVDNCQSMSERIGIPVSVSVVDGSGRTILMARFDQAAFQTPSVACGKALTVVMTRKPSKAVEDATL